VATYMRPAHQRKLKIRYATLFGVAGVATVAGAVYVQSQPADLAVWATLAAVFVYLEFRAVPVNDRLSVSSSAAVAIAAAIAVGREHAVAAVAVMVALSPLQPADFRERRWFQPIANFGMLTLSMALGAVILTPFLPREGEAGNIVLIMVGSVLAASVSGILNVALVRFTVEHVFDIRQVKAWSNLAQILLGYVGLGLMGGFLGVAYLRYSAGRPSLNLMLVLMVVTFLLSHRVFASLSAAREARESTLAGFVKALEAKDLYTRGHTERVAEFAGMLARELGLNGDAQERVRHAALIHDVGKLAVPRELLKKKGRLTTEETQQMRAHVHLIDELLGEVDWLRPIVSIAADHHVNFDGSGYHGSSTAPGTHPVIESRVLAIADAFDAMTSTRSYRVAMSQDYAFSELRRYAGAQFDPEMVEAFIRVIERSGVVYGSPAGYSEAEARRKAEATRFSVDH
jgi:HD-GYP domain-containing protein (c-di-GMP phosphodiesterase class II)